MVRGNGRKKRVNNSQDNAVFFQDIPIVKFTNRENGEAVDNCVFCADILDVLTQNFFAQKGKHVEEKPHVEDVKVKTLSHYICVCLLIIKLS